ncbi:MAG: peptidyl-prolyl cis-trans isomerase [Candidatus Coatesbacteria bacterium]|nr:MAG: peptidyl-prolyl cis-trans isomerase [Candidatus Coatesbacteria bacterium]
MLKSMREGMKPVMWGVAVAFVGALFLGGAVTLTNIIGGDKAKVVMSVNGRNIEVDEFRSRYYRELRAILDEYRESGEDRELDELTQEQIENEALRRAFQYFLTRELIMAQAEELGILVSDEEVIKVIENQPEFQSGGEFNQAQYESVLARRFGITPAEYEEEIRLAVAMSRVQGLIGETGRVSENDVRQQFFDNNRAVECYYTNVMLDEDALEPVSEEAAKEYYENHKDDYRHTEQVRVEYILVSLEEHREKIEVTEEDVKRYYDEHKDDHYNRGEIRASHILIVPENPSDPGSWATAEAEAASVKAVLDAGADFAKTAEEYSDDPGSALNGGDLGFFGPGAMDPEFENAAYGLEEGEISEPVMTVFGYHIIRRDADIPSYDEMAPVIEQQLFDRKLFESAAKDAEEIHQMVLGGLTLREVAVSKGIEVKDSGFFGRDGNVKGLGDQSSLATEAFKLTVGETGDIFPLFQQTPFGMTVPTGYMIWTLTERREPGNVPYEEVKEVVADDAARDAALADLKAKADDIKAELKNAGDEGFLETGRSYGYTTNGPITVRGATRLPELGGFGVVKEALLAAKPGDWIGPLKTPRGYFIAHVVAKEEPGETDYQTSKKRVKAEMMMSLREKMFVDWQSWMQANAIVENKAKEFLEAEKAVAAGEEPLDLPVPFY